MKKEIAAARCLGLEMGNGDCGLRSSDYELRTTDCGLSSSSLLRMPCARDLSAMFAEGEFLEQVCDVLAGRDETHFDAPIGPDRGDTAYQTQWIRDALAQVHLEHTLIA